MISKFFSKIHAYRYKIMLIALLSAIINFFSIVAVIYTTAYPQVKAYRTSVVQQTLNNYSTKLDSFFQEYENGLDQMTRGEAFRRIQDDPEKYADMVITQLRDYQDSHKDIRLISLGTETGKYYFDPNRNSVPNGYDPRVRPWYRLAADAKDDRVYYTGIYTDINTGKSNITMVKALKDSNGNFIGVLGIILDLNHMVEENRANRIGNKGYAFVTLGNQYLIHPSEKIGAFIKDQTISRISYYENNGIYRRMAQGDIEIFNYQHYPKTGWTIWSLGYESELLEPLRSMVLKTFLWSAGIFVFLFTGIMIVSKLMVRDIETLAHAAHKISSGDYGYRVNVRSNDEIGALCADFNQMAMAIELQNQGLIEKSNEIRAQFDEINALYEETQAMNDTLYDLSEQLQESYRMTILTLSNAIEANDYYTKGHCERVTTYSLELGRYFGQSSDRLRCLEYAALLHDVGKIGVSTDVLNKNGRLNYEEIQQVHRHPELGHSILVKVPFLQECAEIILQHHERYDGTGYPLGLKGSEIKLEARMISITDAYDAMTTVRAYRRKPLTNQEAIEQLLANKGTQFDPELVDGFIKMITAS